ncbi:protein ABIL2-like isoform X1 [Juglans microcarpa x Juglans regia]|uniref:protein ABIL2-like isoform X1 n=3 Tax=Juglans microcarpa x Juglans regia TaxID=2249226 RepID=UPI001B7F1A93|nr:protein ABIL2-like isoform X1 [Juglans microcarpa x Juglans regia]
MLYLIRVSPAPFLKNSHSLHCSLREITKYAELRVKRTTKRSSTVVCIINCRTQPNQMEAKNTHFMERVNSTSVSPLQKTSHHDELFMQQRLLFSDSLKELKNLRKQLYSAAEHFEVSYSKEDQKHIVVDTCQDYAIKALVNTVDHLGSVAFKINGLLDGKICELSGTELRFSCIEQRLRTCQYFIDRAGLFQQSMALKFPKHHKQYIIPARTTMDAVGQSQPIYHNAKEDLCQFKSVVRATPGETSPAVVRKGHSALWSAQSSSRSGAFQFTKAASKKALEKRAVSPHRFPFIRSGSLANRLTTINSSTDRPRHPSEPRRPVSSFIHVEREGTKEITKHSGKSKPLFKALLSMHRSKKEGMLFK